MHKMLTDFNSPDIQNKIVRPIEFWKDNNREKIADKSQKKKIRLSQEQKDLVEKLTHKMWDDLMKFGINKF